jgi:hypothetical protein
MSNPQVNVKWYGKLGDGDGVHVEGSSVLGNGRQTEEWAKR